MIIDVKPKKNKLIGKVNKKENGVVTFLDVLGWKGIWKNKERSIDILSNLISDIKKEAKRIQTISVNNEEKGVGLKITILSISDTIVFLSSGTVKDIIPMHTELCRWAIKEGLERGLPLRGAISCGEYENTKNIIIGPAVDEAASWHESTDWIGVILTPSAKFALKGELPRYVVEYDRIPFKKTVKGLTWCVDWEYNNWDELYRKFFEKGPHMQDVASKYLNTLIFLERNRK